MVGRCKHNRFLKTFLWENVLETTSLQIFFVLLFVLKCYCLASFCSFRKSRLLFLSQTIERTRTRCLERYRHNIYLRGNKETKKLLEQGAVRNGQKLVWILHIVKSFSLIYKVSSWWFVMKLWTFKINLKADIVKIDEWLIDFKKLTISKHFINPRGSLTTS